MRMIGMKVFSASDDEIKKRASYLKTKFSSFYQAISEKRFQNPVAKQKSNVSAEILNQILRGMTVALSM